MRGSVALDVVCPFDLHHGLFSLIDHGFACGFNVFGDVGRLEQLLLAVRVDALRASTAVAQENGVEGARVAVDAHGDVFGRGSVILVCCDDVFGAVCRLRGCFCLLLLCCL